MKKMKKYSLLILITILVGLAPDAIAQGKYFTRDGFISFFSSTPVEDIKANNPKVTCVIDASSGAIEMAVLMKAFEFKKALMEEHFNENYVESEKYPKATFKGNIVNFKDIDFTKDGIYPSIVKGSMTIHGVTKEMEAEGSIEIKEGRVILNSTFNIKPEDYDIEIPSVVRDKIAEQMLITLKASLDPFNR